MKIITISILWVILSFYGAHNIYAQNRNRFWAFPDSLSMQFQADSIIIGKTNITTSAYGAGIYAHETSASIADTAGNPLLYLCPKIQCTLIEAGVFNGYYFLGELYDKHHQLLLNGDSIACYNSASNGAIIIPAPDTANRYYLFTLSKASASIFHGTQTERIEALYMHRIDLVNGTGVVSDKNQPVLFKRLSEKLSAVPHSNGKDWWLLTHTEIGDTFVKFLVTAQGISEPIYQKIGSVYYRFGIDRSAGEMVVSPNGKHVASAVYDCCILDLFDFDRCTGELSNFIYLGPPPPCLGRNT